MDIHIESLVFSEYDNDILITYSLPHLHTHARTYSILYSTAGIVWV